jgi:hypothetical protein
MKVHENRALLDEDFVGEEALRETRNARPWFPLQMIWIQSTVGLRLK